MNYAPAPAEQRRAAALQAMLDPHVLLQAVRDESGTIVDFVYTEANQSACDYMRMAADDLVGSRLLDLLPGQAGSGMLGLYAGAIESGEPLALDDFSYPHEILGDERRYDIRAVRIGDALSFTWRDVTDRFRQAEALAASEARYRLLAENASDVVAQAGPDGTIEWVSASVTSLLGWHPEEMVGRKVFEYLHPDDLPVVAAAQARLSHGEALTFEARVRQSDGGYRWVASHVRPLFDDEGNPTGRVAGWRDVHEQHLAAEALAYSEELFRTAMDNSAVGMCLVSPEGHFLRVNAAICEILGRSEDELMASTWQGITHPDDLDEGQDLVDQVLAGERDSCRTRKRYLRPDGSVVWGDLALSCVRNPDGSVRNFVTQVSDVTEMHRAMVNAEEAEHRFRLMASNASDVVFTAGADRLITWVSPNITEALGWRASDLQGQVALSFVHPDDAAGAAPTLDLLYSNAPGPDAHTFRMRWRCADGSYRWMLGLGTRVLTDDGDPDFVVTGLHDIADEVAARSYLTSVLDAAIDPHIMFVPIWEDAPDGGAAGRAALPGGTDAARNPAAWHTAAGPDGRGGRRVVDLEYADVNPAACAYLRHDLEDLLGKRMFELYGGAASEHVLRWCEQAATTGEPVVLDNQTMVSEVTNDAAWFDIRAVPVNGQVSLTFRDISARHQAARELEASEEKFRLLAENATDAVLHAREGILVWLSPSLEGLLGWAPEDWVGHRFEEFTHPEDVPLAQQRRREINAGNTRITRLRMRDREGTFHWVEVHASPFIDRDGHPDGIVASFRTIDDQVHAEKVLEDRARFDELTGLLNRAEVFTRLRTMIGQHPRTGHETAVAFCDLDGFKEINDTYGHEMGDYVLKTIADDLRDLLRDDDLVARLGGDEILLVLPGVHGLESAAEVAERVRRSAARTHEYRGIPYTAALSIGVTILRRDEEPDAVIARADKAMYEAKSAGGNRVVAV